MDKKNGLHINYFKQYKKWTNKLSTFFIPLNENIFIFYIWNWI